MDRNFLFVLSDPVENEDSTGDLQDKLEAECFGRERILVNVSDTLLIQDEKLFPLLGPAEIMLISSRSLPNNLLPTISFSKTYDQVYIPIGINL